MIYFIQAGDGPVKIGYSEDVSKRFRELQCGNHLKLRLLRSIDGGRGVEAWLHRTYAGQRVRGEWFAFAESMLTIERGLIVPIVREPERQPDFIDQLGGCSAVAKLLGIGARCISNWHERGIPHRYRYTLAWAADERGISFPSKFLGGFSDEEAVAFIRSERERRAA